MVTFAPGTTAAEREAAIKSFNERQTATDFSGSTTGQAPVGANLPSEPTPAGTPTPVVTNSRLTSINRLQEFLGGSFSQEDIAIGGQVLSGRETVTEGGNVTTSVGVSPPAPPTIVSGGDATFFDTSPTGTGGGTTPAAIGAPEAISDAERINRENILDPQLPTGTEVSPIFQQLTDAEVQKLRELGATPEFIAALAELPDRFAATTVDAATISERVEGAEAAEGIVREQALVAPAQSEGIEGVVVEEGRVTDKVSAAQIAPSEEFQVQAAEGELSADAMVTAVTAQASDAFLQATAALQIEIANSPVDPRATVREQYAQLMDFGPNEVPDWAKGALRVAEQRLNARGISSSTIAGEAITTALMQAALPIAQQDAKMFETIGLQKLNTRAQIGILKASHLANLDIKNAEFKQQAAVVNASSALQINLANLDNEQQARIVSARLALDRAMQNAGFEQQAEIENARNALTMDTANLDVDTRVAIENARNALTIEAQNLNNRQQANVENARSFMNMDMANLSNRQQTAIVNSQTRVQALLSDQAAINASRQFNAQNETQVNTFFAGMAADISKFNSVQQTDAAKFAVAMQDARERFDVQNAILIDQANVKYLRDINTRNNAVENQFHLTNATNLLNISNTAMANELTLLRDKNSFIFQSSENALERSLRQSLAELDAQTRLRIQDLDQQFVAGQATGALIADIAGDVIGGIFSSFGEGSTSGSSGGGGRGGS